MSVADQLVDLQPAWLSQVVPVLAPDVHLRADLRAQLERFYTALLQMVETGSPEGLDPLIAEWSMALTLGDLQSQSGTLTRFITSLMESTSHFLATAVESGQALALILALSSGFSYALESASHHETQAKIAYLTNQLAQTRAELEKMEKSKADFVAVAGHELKTPLTLIEGYTAMLKEVGAAEEDAQASTELIAGIQNGTRRLRAIVDDMIDVSLIDNHLLALNQQPVWLNRLFQFLATELESDLNRRGQTLSVHSFPGSDEMIFGDPDRLSQLFRNLLVNAIKFTPDNGHIWVDGRKLPGFIEIIVSDDGIGIDLDDQAIVFEKFARLGNVALHSSGKTKFKGGGPGLGLHIVKGIVSAHNGAIWVESEGHDEQRLPGTTFHILLPIASQATNEKVVRLFTPIIQQNSNDKP